MGCGTCGGGVGLGGWLLGAAAACALRSMGCALSTACPQLCAPLMSCPPNCPGPTPCPGRASPDEYSALIKAGDAAGLMDLLTDVAVEQKVVERVRLKAATFGQDIGTGGSSSSGDGAPHYKVAPDALAAIYNDVVMPLTKDVQVAYLLRRLD